jgi:hypothetical protein
VTSGQWRVRVEERVVPLFTRSSMLAVMKSVLLR